MWIILEHTFNFDVSLIKVNYAVRGTSEDLVSLYLAEGIRIALIKNDLISPLKGYDAINADWIEWVEIDGVVSI